LKEFKRYCPDGGKTICPADGHFGPMTTENDRQPRQMIEILDYDFLFTINSNHGSISCDFQSIDDVSFSTSVTFGGHTATLAVGFHFKQASY